MEAPGTTPRNPQPQPKDRPILRPISIFRTGSFTPGAQAQGKATDKLRRDGHPPNAP
jgi:hypothetical protein